MNISNPYSRVFHGHSRVRKVASLNTYAVGPIRCITVSPDGKFLAVGSDDGILEIRMFESNVWRRVGLYASGGAIRAVVWHPFDHTTVFFGSANGNIHKVTVVANGVDIICDGTVPGYVHGLELSPDGQMLAIAHGRSISIVKDPFPQRDDLGTLANLEIAGMDHSRVQSIVDCKIPRAMCFLPGNQIILVAFLGGHDLCAYSTVENTLSWSISLRPHSFVGSAAIFPSGERLAIMNLQDGIDFYSISHRRYLCTTEYTMSRRDPPRNLIVDLKFIDEETVAFGHSDGYVAFATFGVNTIAGNFRIGDDGSRVPLQHIGFGITEGLPYIYGLVSMPETTRSHTRFISEIYIGRIDTPIAHGSIALQPSQPVPPGLRLTKVQVAFVILIGIFTALLVKTIFASGQQRSDIRSELIPPIAPEVPERLEAAFTSSRDLCVCTVTGSVVSSAYSAKETGHF